MGVVRNPDGDGGKARNEAPAWPEIVVGELIMWWRILTHYLSLATDMNSEPGDATVR